MKNEQYFHVLFGPAWPFHMSPPAKALAFFFMWSPTAVSKTEASYGWFFWLDKIVMTACWLTGWPHSSLCSVSPSPIYINARKALPDLSWRCPGNVFGSLWHPTGARKTEQLRPFNTFLPWQISPLLSLCGIYPPLTWRTHQNGSPRNV